MAQLCLFIETFTESAGVYKSISIFFFSSGLFISVSFNEKGFE